MNIIIIAAIFFLTNDFTHAKQYQRSSETSASKDEVNSSAEETENNSEEPEENPTKSKETSDFESPLVSSLEYETRYPFSEENSGLGLNRAYVCSRLKCPKEDMLTPVCACNFVTGKVATFQNKCDSKKHNCRFETDFKVMLNSICPWEFASRRKDEDYIFDYRDPKYYNLF